jgi:sialate O-acetylesterase
MIAPLLPCSIRGAAWYQGESNTANPQLYRKLLPVLIQGWRQSWGQGDFPFLYVQLPGFRLQKSLPADSEWAELREAQSLALKLPRTGMAVTIDLGENNIHPANKQEVGRRLGLLAEAGAYGDDIVASGPVFASSKINGSQILLGFKQLDGGLVAKDGGALKGFAIAGADKKFVWADAKIEGNNVLVSSSQVPKPVAVRYAWADNPDCNLCGKGGLPAAPFRTDNW